MRNYVIDQENNRLDLTDLRFYFDEEGMWWPSVTTVLDSYPKSAHFFEWLKQEGANADVIRDEAGDHGTAVHGLTEAYDNGETVSILDPYGTTKYSAKAWAQFERYVEFSRRFRPEILFNELRIVDRDLKVGGTLDRVMEFPKTVDVVGGKTLIIDIKTSGSLYNHYWIQQVIYKEMFEKKYGIKLDGVAILWLNAKTKTDGKKGTIQGPGWQMCFPEKDLDHYRRLWDCVYALFMEENEDLKPRNLSYTIKHTKLKIA